MTPVAFPAWIPPLVWVGVVALCGGLFVIGIALTGAGAATANVLGLLGGSLFLWVGYRIASAAWQGHAMAQGALIIASFALMAAMADGWSEPVNYLDYEPFRFLDGLLRALPGLILAVLFAGRRSGAYFAERERRFADDTPDSDPS